MEEFFKLKSCPWEIKYGLPLFGLGLGARGRFTDDAQMKQDAGIILWLWIGFWLVFAAVKAAIIEANNKS